MFKKIKLYIKKKQSVVTVMLHLVFSLLLLTAEQITQNIKQTGASISIYNHPPMLLTHRVKLYKSQHLTSNH